MTRLNHLILFLSLFCFMLNFQAACAEDPAMRSWKDSAGREIAKGEFVSLMDGEVCIITPQGTGKTIPLDSLSKEDRRFAESQGEDLAAIEGSLPEVEQIGQPVKAKKTVAPIAPTLSNEMPKGPDLEIKENDVIAEAGSGEARGDIQRKVKDEAEKHQGLKRVVMFDFESLWDADSATRYGEIMGNMFWMKLNREKGFVIPESMIDVRSVCEAKKIKPNPDTPMDQMKEYVTKVFNSDIGIWGKIERVDKDVMEIYDFWIKVVDFSHNPPKVLYEVNRARTEAVAEVTGIYVRHAMDKLYDRQARTEAERKEIETAWKNNPNLIVGGDFEKVKGGVPVGWESRCAQHREPIGRLVRRVQDPENPDNHYMHFEMDPVIAEGFGLMWYSKPFPIEETATYRIEYKYRKSEGMKLILFIKCYDTIDTTFTPTANALKEGFEDKLGQQTREVYRSQQNLIETPPNVWIEHSQEFTPRHTRFSPKLGRVMMFGYWAAGQFDFDDFVLKKVKEPDKAELKAKVNRHSLDSKVTLKEMEENERRGSQTVQEIKKELKDGPSKKKKKTKLK